MRLGSGGGGCSGGGGGGSERRVAMSGEGGSSGGGGRDGRASQTRAAFSVVCRRFVACSRRFCCDYSKMRRCGDVASGSLARALAQLTEARCRRLGGGPAAVALAADRAAAARGGGHRHAAAAVPTRLRLKNGARLLWRVRDGRRHLNLRA